MKFQSKITAGMVLACGFLAASAAQAADAFKVDHGHSNVIFRVSHMGAGMFYARFNDISGTFLLDADNPANSSRRLPAHSQ